ncbi:hypothetical protein M0813_13878 [Anaeramoeba flamelloides]|uniref:Uncharacterized protein n=1 Tax=Anaeramoeba flamelloides TaxID=1746091 RepID=A0AAV8AEB1_9EUKA|nr:hypothetical protein M0812_03713 [Anaeramoeba flamelloides]KAJ6252669.1 hypothetical protein M0813_13878 [Anaeramoeba flamelloides]
MVSSLTLFNLDLVFVVVCVVFFVKRLYRQAQISEKFRHVTSNNAHLVSQLPPELSTLYATLVSLEERVIYCSIPTSHISWTILCSWIFSLGNFSALLIGAISYVMSSRKGLLEVPLSPFVLQILISVLVNLFCFRTVDRKLSAMYVITDQKVYLIGNFHLRFSFSFVRDHRIWDLNELPELTVIEDSFGEGHILFDREINVNTNNKKETQIGFRYINSVRDVELLIRKEIDLKAINQNSKSNNHETQNKSHVNQSYSNSDQSFEKELEFELNDDLNNLETEKRSYQNIKLLKKD